jgi:NarL family two-component system response regulator YdfI
MPSYRRTVRTGLEDYPSDVLVVGEAADGEEAIRLTDQLHPDVVLLDIRMRGMDGMVALQILQERHPECCIILLTSHNERDLVIQGIQLGAVSYILKEYGGEELVQAINAAYHGQSYFSPPVATTVREELLKARPLVTPIQTRLSTQEIAVLRGVANGRKYREIAQELLLSEGTVAQYIQRIMGKLKADSRAHAVAIAKDQGII